MIMQKPLVSFNTNIHRLSKINAYFALKYSSFTVYILTLPKSSIQQTHLNIYTLTLGSCDK